MEDFYWNSTENPVEQWSQILWNETRAKKCFLGLSRHFNGMSTVALPVAVVGVTSLLPHAKKLLEVLPTL
jgi:hypothetical protein